jgi:hypothetical protein
MKNLSFLLIFIYLFTACTKSDDSPIVSEEPANELVGKWKMLEFRPGLGPTGIYNGEMTWLFNNNNTLDVNIVNGTSLWHNFPMRNTGNYPYLIHDAITVQSSILVALNGQAWLYEIDNNILTLNDGFGTEPRFIMLERIP